MTKKLTVFAPGAWDLFHIGHLNLLGLARNIAGHLFVGVDTDESIEKKKGSPPIIPFYERVAILRACSYVDEIFVTLSGSVDLRQLDSLNIDIVVLGSDWKYGKLKNKKEALATGVKFQYFSYTDHISTSKIREEIIKRHELSKKQEDIKNGA